MCSQHSVYCVRAVQHIKCLLFSFCRQFIFVARLWVLDLRHGAHNGSRKSHVFISSLMVAEPVLIHGSAIECVGDPSETGGESVGCGTSCSSDC